MKRLLCATLSISLSLSVSTSLVDQASADPRTKLEFEPAPGPLLAPDLRGTPPCPGPADFIPAYSFSDLSAAILANPASRIKLCNNIDALGATIPPLGYIASNQEPVPFLWNS